MTKNNRRGIIAGLLAVITMQGGTALAQSQERGSDALEEIIVMAQRRAQSMQDVPITLNSFSGEDLKVRGVVELVDITTVIPNVDLKQSHNNLNVFVRGIGSDGGNPNIEPSLATYVDGIYMPHPGSSTFLSLANVEQIALLKGPQGTLFGRNASGGVLQIETRNPTQETVVEASLGYGNYETTTASAYVSTGIGENLAVNASVYHFDRAEGFGMNLFLAREIHTQKQTGYRTKLSFTPTERTSVMFGADYSKGYSDHASQLFPGVTGIDGVNRYDGDYNTRNGSYGYYDAVDYGTSLRVNHELNDMMSLTSTSAYRYYTHAMTRDTDKTALFFSQSERENSPGEALTQEFQLLSGESSPFEWVAGAYYFHYDSAVDPNRASGTSTFNRSGQRANYVDAYGRQITESYSVYGQTTFNIFEKTRLITGLRWTDDAYEIDGRLTTLGGPFGAVGPGFTITRYPLQKYSWDDFTWRLALDYQLSEDALVYASFDRGIRSGGFGLNNAGGPSFEPEYVTAYEFGLKSEWLDQRLRFNSAAFYYDYTNKLVQLQIDGITTQFNAAGAEIYGVEFDLEYRLTEQFKVTTAAGLLSAKYSKYDNAVVTDIRNVAYIIPDASGMRLLQAPKFNGMVSAEYRVPSVSVGDFLASVNAIHTSSSCEAVDCHFVAPGNTRVNASFGWTSLDERYGVKLWARNLLDERYIGTVDPNSGPGVIWADPRTFGITFDYKMR